MSSSRKCDNGGNWGLAGVGLVAFMISCCAAGPLLLVGLATLSGAALFGVDAGVLLTIALVWIVVLTARSKRSVACDLRPGLSAASDRSAQQGSSRP